MQSQPELDVNCAGESGTRVACVGCTLHTRSIYLASGYPSMLNSVVKIGFRDNTSLRVICLSSGLGCTVMPCAPNFSQLMAASITSGLLPPRALRKVAILLIFTLNCFSVFLYQKKIVTLPYRKFLMSLFRPQKYEILLTYNISFRYFF